MIERSMVLLFARIFAVGGIVSGLAMGTSAAEIPYVGDAMRLGNEAGHMQAASIWALAAGLCFAAMAAMGYFCLTLGTKIQTALATISAKQDALAVQTRTCPNAESASAIVAAARTEIERCGQLIRSGK